MKKRSGPTFLSCGFTLNKGQKNTRAGSAMIWPEPSEYSGLMKGAKRASRGTFEETNTIGTKSFEFVPDGKIFGMSVQLGFLSTNQRYTVYITALDFSGGMEPSIQQARDIAKEIDSRLPN